MKKKSSWLLVALSVVAMTAYTKDTDLGVHANTLKKTPQGNYVLSWGASGGSNGARDFYDTVIDLTTRVSTLEGSTATVDIEDLKTKLKYIDVSDTRETFEALELWWSVSGQHVVIGAGATNCLAPFKYTVSSGTNKATVTVYKRPRSINICPYSAYPSYTYGDFNINLGIDNLVGHGQSASANASYAIGIGTTVRAKRMHSYAIGSQINNTYANSTALGYGLSTGHGYSTVIGHGKRPLGTSEFKPEKTFDTEADMRAWLMYNNISTWFVGYHFGYNTGRTYDDGGTEQIAYTVFTVTKVLSTPNSLGEWVEYVQTADTDDPECEFQAGQYDWRYGHTHGQGTFNIVAYNSSGSPRESLGLKAVYINDDNLYDLIKASNRLILKPAQINKGVTCVKDGYEQNGAVEIGPDAVAAVSQAYVDGLTSKTTIRNVSVAIGARATAIGSGGRKTTGQSIAIGYCANAEGGQAIAIGPGARHLTDETDETGHNAWASGGTSIAIGYSAKATGYGSVAIGSGNGGHVLASADNTVAIGRSAQVTAPNSVQLGSGTNTEERTLKFMDTVIVRNGAVVGNFDATSLDPKTVEISNPDGGEYPAHPHVVNTIDATTNLTPGAEIGLNPVGTRNYEVFVPNDPEEREGMPMWVYGEIPTNITVTYTGKKMFAKTLPAMIKVQQPSAKYMVITINELEDEFDWTPVITNTYIRFSNDDKKFYCDSIGRSLGRSIEGTSLHLGNKFNIIYPTNAAGLRGEDGGILATNTVIGANSIRLETNVTPEAYLIGTFYGFVVGFSSLSVPDIYVDTTVTTSTWYKVEYGTLNGETVSPLFPINLTE